MDKGGAGDQGVMYGYATNETPELLPIPFAVATRFIKLLRDVKAPMLCPDAKAQVSYDYESGKITTFLCSVQHTADSAVKDFRSIIESLMELTAAEYGLNSDFEKLINPTGKFVVGGSNADTGVTGRKLACDTYGGVGKIGGGALYGKDPSKVDRSAAYMARKIAVDLVTGGYCDRCEVQIAYASVRRNPSPCLWTPSVRRGAAPDASTSLSKRTTTSPCGGSSGSCTFWTWITDVAYGGHFGKNWLPWEIDEELAEDIYGGEE